MDETTRRRFLKAAGATGVALAAGPATTRGQGGGKTTLALVGCAHIHVVPGSTLSEPVTGLAKGPTLPLLQWVEAVGGASGQPLVTPREAAARVVVMEAAYESARAGRWVGVAG
jgi:hypothetical protein